MDDLEKDAQTTHVNKVKYAYIGTVSYVWGPRTIAVLQRNGIDAYIPVMGRGAHIAVPLVDGERAIEMLKQDAKQNGYEDSITLAPRPIEQ
jgi:hypothetical protein